MPIPLALTALWGQYRLYIIGGAVLALLTGAYFYHRSVVRDAIERATVNERTRVFKELAVETEEEARRKLAELESQRRENEYLRGELGKEREEIADLKRQLDNRLRRGLDSINDTLARRHGDDSTIPDSELDFALRDSLLSLRELRSVLRTADTTNTPIN